MNQLFEFLLANSLWSSALLLLLAGYGIFEIIARKKTMQHISAEQLLDLVNHQGALLMDIRDKEAFEHEHIINSKLIDPAQEPKSLTKYKDKHIIIICKRGLSAANFALKLRTAGFEHVYILAGGLNKWKIDGNPVTNLERKNK